MGTWADARASNRLDTSLSNINDTASTPSAAAAAQQQQPQLQGEVMTNIKKEQKMLTQEKYTMLVLTIYD